MISNEPEHMKITKRKKERTEKEDKNVLDRKRSYLNYPHLINFRVLFYQNNYLERITCSQCAPLNLPPCISQQTLVQSVTENPIRHLLCPQSIGITSSFPFPTSCSACTPLVCVPISDT